MDSSVLQALFTSKVRIRLLSRLVLSSRQEYYLGEICALEQVPAPAALTELRRLKKLRLVLDRTKAGRHYWMADREHLLFPELKALLLKSILLRRAIDRPSIRTLLDKIDVAFVFGSFARNEEDAQSDLDVVVVGSIGGIEMGDLFNGVSTETGHEFNPVRFTEEEFRSKAREREGFVKRILQDPRIFIVGNEHELSKVVERHAEKAAPRKAQGKRKGDRKPSRSRRARR